jgi:hypothetical protein
MPDTERQAAIKDVLKSCQQPGRVMGKGSSLSPSLLGRPWQRDDDHAILSEAMQSLLAQQLARARHSSGLALPVSDSAAIHQEHLKHDIAAQESTKVLSVLWAHYICELSAQQIGDICGWSDRRSQQFVKAGRSYIESLLTKIEAERSRNPSVAINQQEIDVDEPEPLPEPEPDEPISPARAAIDDLRRHLVADKQLHDLTGNEEFDNFDLIGYRRTRLALEFVAMVQADDLNERRIVNLRKQYFEIVKTLPSEFGLRPHGRNPNGLLGFVYASPPSERQIAFIKDQSQAWFWGDGGIVFSWTIDMAARRIHTHNQLVSAFPPLFIATRFVFPGLEYLQSLIERYPD